MNLCKTCNHWKTPSKNHVKMGMCRCYDPITFEDINPPFEVRICEHPSKRFCDRPLEKNGFALADASDYFACLVTAEDFGCVRHEPKEPT